MSTYKIIDYAKAGNMYVAVYSHGSREHRIDVPAVLNTDGTIHIEHTKDAISNAIIEHKKLLDADTPKNAGSMIGSTFEINAELSQFMGNPESAEEL